MELIASIAALIILFYAYTRFSFYFRHQKKNMDRINKTLREIKELLEEKNELQQNNNHIISFLGLHVQS